MHVNYITIVVLMLYLDAVSSFLPLDHVMCP